MIAAVLRTSVWTARDRELARLVFRHRPLLSSTVAKEAVDRACAHVGADADAQTLVAKVRELDRCATRAAEPLSEPEASVAELAPLACQALVTSGFKKPAVQRAVAAALKRVPATCDLGALLREARRHCVDDR